MSRAPPVISKASRSNALKYFAYKLVRKLQLYLNEQKQERERSVYVRMCMCVLINVIFAQVYFTKH